MLGRMSTAAPAAQAAPVLPQMATLQLLLASCLVQHHWMVLQAHDCAEWLVPSVPSQDPAGPCGVHAWLQQHRQEQSQEQQEQQEQGQKQGALLTREGPAGDDWGRLAPAVGCQSWTLTSWTTWWLAGRGGQGMLVEHRDSPHRDSPHGSSSTAAATAGFAAAPDCAALLEQQPHQAEVAQQRLPPPPQQ